MGKEKKRTGRVALALSNIALILIAVLFTIWYSENVRTSQERLMRENFCNTVDTMKQISEHYISGELETAANWASYIEREHMTMEQAMDYIRAISDPSDCEAHFVDMDTFEAWSTNEVGGSNTIKIYERYFSDNETATNDYVVRMRKMFNGEKYLLGKYTVWDTQRTVISVGLPVHLKQADGSEKGYLLLRVVPIESMKKLWLFPVSYSAAEIGLIDDQGWYVIPSRSMRSENFMEFVRYYNFPDDFYSADRVLAQLKEQQSGLMELKNSRGEDCYWYYSRLDDFIGLDILGYIPVSELTVSSSNVSIVIAVSGMLLLIVLIDGAYILNINRKLRATAEIAKKASNAKTQFLSSMSHDIRTPLNAVLGMTELAQTHKDDSAYVQECLRKISVSGNHLLTLINDILEISRVESGKIDVNPAPFDVQMLGKELESVIRSQTVGHGLTLQTQIGDLPAPWLMGDKLRLTQVYLNLLNNAVKYTGPGGTVRLELKEEQQEDDSVMLVCVVADTGVGMSAEFMETMYDAFSRVHDSRIDKIQGTGLGLAIVKRMVNLMQGTIDCESIEGRGTTFTVRIPLDVAPEETVAGLQTEQTHQMSGGDLAGLHVLIAEDNDLNWEIISTMLDGYGILCERAENGRECVDRLRSTAPDTFSLVLMDVQMPILNGRDATRELRSGDREDLRRIPVIAMTADAFAEDVQICIDAGMDAHVAKPIEIEKVLAAIRLVLSRKGSADSR